MSTLTYSESGVNIQAGEDAVNRIKSVVRSTFNRNVLTEIGSFGGLYALDLSRWVNPVLVSSTDGVGTKLIVAGMAQRYDTVGQCLVNHCVNDIYVQGAHPQFFLDYIGVGKLDPLRVQTVLEGMAKACRENELALIGGEMAEMPGIYPENELDLVGTIVGLVERDKVLTGAAITEGDIVIGFPSTGLHTNGYSLARKVIFDRLKLRVDTRIESVGATVGEALLAVHRSYYPMLRDFSDAGQIHGMAHITGGGIPGNLKRVIPDGLTARIDCNSWETPALFRFIQEAGGIDTEEMYRAFNMGIGFIVVTDAGNADAILAATDGFRIGTMAVADDDRKVRLDG